MAGEAAIEVYGPWPSVRAALESLDVVEVSARDEEYVVLRLPDGALATAEWDDFDQTVLIPVSEGGDTDIAGLLYDALAEMVGYELAYHDRETFEVTRRRPARSG